ncbi:MAG: hypothetical protein H6Q03_1506 [Acidobacteria bacterium]|nr:hypothetical protein [Acidobacteriota bacterium]
MPLPRPSRRALRIGIIALAAAALAIVAERSEWVRALGTGGTARAWIWAPVELRDVRPRAFFAAREFELAAVPQRAILEVLGDEEYVAWANGWRIGSGRYRAGAPLDRYEVARFLRPGANRLVLELRSVTGAGGATLRLVDGEGRVLAATGPRWSVFQQTWRGLVSGETIPWAPRAAVLGLSPFGRWGSPAPGPLEPVLADTIVQSRPERATRFRLPLESGLWLRLPRGDSRRPPLGPLVEFDFGAEVTGYLVLAVRDPETAIGLVRLGSTPAESSGWVPDDIAVVAPQRGVWQASEPRRFRYVEVAGLDEVRSAAVLRLAPGQPAPPDGPGGGAGLFGISSPPRRRPVEDAIWRRLRDRPRMPPLEPLAGTALRPSGAGRSPARARAPGARPRPGDPPAQRAPRPRAGAPGPGPLEASPPGAPAPGSRPR